MDIRKEKIKNIKRIIASIACCILAIVAFVSLIIDAETLPLDIRTKTCMIVLGIVVFIVGISLAVLFSWSAGTYECPHCKTRFVPTKTAYIMGIHTITKRRLKCPKCNQKSWCKWTLNH